MRACDGSEAFRLMACVDEHIVCQNWWARNTRACDCSEAIRLITCAHESIGCEILWTCDIDLGKASYYLQGDLPRPEVDGRLEAADSSPVRAHYSLRAV